MKLEYTGLVGYGEVSKTFCAGLKDSVISVCAWDLKFDAVNTSALELEHASRAGVHACASM